MVNTAIFVASWLIVGPGAPLSIALSLIVLGMATVLPHHFRYKTASLIGVMGIMFVQCVLVVFLLHFQLLNLSPPPNQPPLATLFSLLVGADVRLAELGVVAGIVVGLYVEFGCSRLSLSQSFPSLSFCEPTSELVKVVQGLADTAGMACPDVQLIDSGEMLAFSVRIKRRYIIALSVGLLESLEPIEVQACLAHEICHIKNKDFSLRLIVAITRAALFARVLSYFVETSFYRTRELLADRTAALLIGTPNTLISALTKIQLTDSASDNTVGSQVCCLRGNACHFEILSKHPSIKTRIRMLESMASAK
ncbi:MAG TPA: M48 family metalloprotease [Terriglobales bacterium]|nr:M48 family metalloprotease [Terriglobales bacterium]